jgi:copper chaperone NosL
MKAKIALLLGALLLTACGRADVAADAPPPREVTDASVAQFCGMTLTEHPGPKAQIFVRGLNDPYWFASVRDAFAFTMLQETPKAIAAIYVNDMARAKDWRQPEAGTWVEAHQAFYVIDSRRRGGMGADEAIPFGVADAAQAFAKVNGGRVVRFAEMPRAYVLASAAGDRP